jgi:hypothetical protein
VLSPRFVGYDLLESLILLSQEEIEELSVSIKMKPGHKRRFPVAVQKAREDMQEQEEMRKRDKAKREKEAKREEEEQDEKRKRERAKHEREREREEEDQEDKQKRDRRVAQELADIEAGVAVAAAQAKARNTTDQNTDGQHGKPATYNSTGLAMPASKSKLESKGVDLPANKSYAAFISHKKVTIENVA